MFSVSTENNLLLYQSASYRTMFEAVAAMYGYVRQQWPAGSLFAVWYYGAISDSLPRLIAYRVRPELPKIYGANYYGQIDPNMQGSTPQEACHAWAVYLTGHPEFLKPLIYYPSGNGRGVYRCEWFGTVPEADCTPCGLAWNLDIKCDAPRTKSRNDDPNGEYVCGFNYYAQVTSKDTTPEKPDECPEGNPIVPGSAQKTHYEVDYDDGRFLKFSRSYGSQRFGPVVGGFTPWSWSYASGLTSAPGELAGASYRDDGTVARIYSDRSTGAIAPTAADMPYKGQVTLTNGLVSGYTLYSPFEPYVEQFDSEGRLLRRINADGSYQALTYSVTNFGYGRYPTEAPVCALQTQVPAMSALQCVTDPFGRQLTLDYTLSGLRSRLIDPAGGVVQYAYDEPTSYYNPTLRGPFGNLTSVRRQDGTVRQYHYNEPENTEGVDQSTMMTGISDQAEDGTMRRFGIYKYDAGGQAILSEHSGGADRHIVTYQHTGDTSLQSTVTRPLGASFTHSYTKVQGSWRKVSTAQPAGAGSLACNDSKTYDPYGNVTSRVDFNGNKTCFVHDSARKLEIKRVEGVDAGVECATALSSPPDGARIIHTQWHPSWPLKTGIAEPKKITTFAYNGQNANCAPSTVLVDGKPPAVICSKTEQATVDASGASGFNAGLEGLPRVWTYTYATYGRVLTATDPNGKTSNTTYYGDDDPDLGRRGNIATVTNAAGHVTRFTAYNLHGQPTRTIDPNGLITDLIYDARMRLTSRKVGSQLMTVTYTPAGKVKTITLPDGSSLTNTYDAAQRVIAVQDHKGNRVDYALDAAGNRIGEQARDPNGALERNIQRSIDVLNRVQQMVGLQ